MSSKKTRNRKREYRNLEYWYKSAVRVNEVYVNTVNKLRAENADLKTFRDNAKLIETKNILNVAAHREVPDSHKLYGQYLNDVLLADAMEKDLAMDIVSHLIENDMIDFDTKYDFEGNLLSMDARLQVLEEVEKCPSK